MRIRTRDGVISDVNVIEKLLRNHANAHMSPVLASSPLQVKHTPRQSKVEPLELPKKRQQHADPKEASGNSVKNKKKIQSQERFSAAGKTPANKRNNWGKQGEEQADNLVKPIFDKKIESAVRWAKKNALIRSNIQKAKNNVTRQYIDDLARFPHLSLKVALPKEPPIPIAPIWIMTSKKRKSKSKFVVKNQEAHYRLQTQKVRTPIRLEIQPAQIEAPKIAASNLSRIVLAKIPEKTISSKTVTVGCKCLGTNENCNWCGGAGYY
ncbi:hypothetical protein [Glaciimonas immobilis]|uniref:Uncharacterized protein n=1 Tax=Glaciimonas immobilis TaxID=728004 RepID=A0A840RMS0_9BURK|nr:hypothetical protein [Glaciimonas immobilis]KAF3998897.1 hypothetical protein HAV38_02745 [Glaciimonas immobilis]MBB5198296.1 hypothetical protein [Glaciimonas immobilis]